MKENLLLHVDVGPIGAVLRFTLGLVFATSLRRALPGVGWLGATALLLVVLFGVKAATALARRATGATPRVAAGWAWRRELAAHHDSYQLRKLVWIGAGILCAAWVAGPPSGWETGLGAAGMATGLVAEGFWRRMGLSVDPPARP